MSPFVTSRSPSSAHPECAVERFRRLAPDKPYCASDFGHGLRIRARNSALRYRHIQPNAPWLLRYMVFDADRAGASMAWDDAGLPAPTWVSQNPANGHAHLVYELTYPVYAGNGAKPEPIHLFRDVRDGFLAQLDADRQYTGLTCKNPCHPDWRTFQPGGGHTYAYSG